MNQHYVPEFYLKYFSQNGKQIFVYDKVVQKSFSNSISSIASQQSFYDNSNYQSIEKEIGEIESRVGIVLKDLIESLTCNKFDRINQKQKKVLIQFIWLQMNRTLESRIKLGSMAPYLFSKLNNVPFELNIKELLTKPEVADNHIDFLNSSKENKTALKTLGSRNFIIIKNETQTDFLTSDEPVVRYSHWDSYPSMYEIFLPITARFGIWIVPKNIFKELDNSNEIIFSMKNEENILFYNYLQIYRSTRQIFSLTGNFEYVNKIFQNDSNFGNLNKKRME